MPKTILVLAASRYQLPTITSAKRLGYRVITTDNLPENPGHALADVNYLVDTLDKQAILELAGRERIDGIISPCTDVSVPTAAFVAEKLGLLGIPYSSASIICDKIAFSEFLELHNFPHPLAFQIHSEYRPSAAVFHQPWLIKPDRSSGSKGIFAVRTENEFYERLPECMNFSPARRGILQQFILGSQGTCEGVLVSGELALTFVLDRQTVDLPYVVTSGHHLPTCLAPKLQARLFDHLRRLWRLLNVTSGPFDCDFVATQDEVYILEVTARMGGNSISTLINKAANFDLVEYSVKQAVGEPVRLPSSVALRPMALILLGVTEPGLLDYDRDEAEALLRESWVDSISWDVPYGQAVLPFINGRHRVGEAFIYGADRMEVDARVVEFKRRLNLKASSSKCYD